MTRLILVRHCTTICNEGGVLSGLTDSKLSEKGKLQANKLTEFLKNEKIDKISNNIVSYCANFDDRNFIHICSIDTNGKLLHFIYKNGKIRRRSLCKVCHNVSNLISMRLFIIRNYLNVFLVEESSLKENCYRISHYNFSPTNYNIQKHYFNNTIKNNIINKSFFFRLK